MKRPIRWTSYSLLLIGFVVMYGALFSAGGRDRPRENVPQSDYFSLFLGEFVVVAAIVLVIGCMLFDVGEERRAHAVTLVMMGPLLFVITVYWVLSETNLGFTMMDSPDPPDAYSDASGTLLIASVSSLLIGLVSYLAISHAKREERDSSTSTMSTSTITRDRRSNASAVFSGGSVGWRHTAIALLCSATFLAAVAIVGGLNPGVDFSADWLMALAILLVDLARTSLSRSRAASERGEASVWADQVAVGLVVRIIGIVIIVLIVASNIKGVWQGLLFPFLGLTAWVVFRLVIQPAGSSPENDSSPQAVSVDRSE